MKQFTSSHNLDFECAPWPICSEWTQYRIGTCHGLWMPSKGCYDILAVTNETPGNGHFEDVLEWFENSCKRDNYDLRILEVWNYEFKHHLITKRGFENYHEDNLIKKFNHGKI